MLRLRPYHPCDAQVITSWPKSEFAMRQWSANRYPEYPVRPEQMNAYYASRENHGKLWAMTAFHESGVVGHLTMRFPGEEWDVLRFGFVIVDDRQRGRGYGKEMISLAAQYAFTCVGVEKITLGVFENNPNAMRCYQSCGFQPVFPARTTQYECMGQMWNCLEMELPRAQWAGPGRSDAKTP